MRRVNGSRAEAEMNESSACFEMRVPGAWNLHWMAQQPPARSSATRSIPVSCPEKSGRRAAHSVHRQTFENWSA